MNKEEFKKLTQDFSGEELAEMMRISNEAAAKGQPIEPEQAAAAVILNRKGKVGKQHLTADQEEGARMLNEALSDEEKKAIEERSKELTAKSFI